MDNKDFIINVLSQAVEFRSLEGPNHIKHVKQFSLILANYFADNFPEYNLTMEDVQMIAQASCLHDLGKLSVPDEILLKSEKLSDEEFEEIKKHTIYGCELLEQLTDEENKFYSYCYDICRYHHERYDGKGYPDGLKGDNIPISAQIVCIADVFDALVSPRVYKLPYDPYEACDMIMNGECGVFSKDILIAFDNLKESFLEILDY